MRKIVLTLAIMLFAFSAYSNDVHAANSPLLGGKYSSGISSLSYWYDNGLGSNSPAYVTHIANAAKNWNSASSEISSFTKSSSVLNSKIDFYLKTSSFSLFDSNTLAITTFYSVKDTTGNDVPSKQVDYETQNWAYTKIFINSNTMSSLSSYKQEGVVSHEIGHALGLAHNTSTTYSIMYPYGDEVMVNTPQAVDYNPLSSLY